MTKVRRKEIRKMIEMLIDTLGVGGFFLLIMTVGGLVGAFICLPSDKPRR
jgi:hypothetical protein